MKKVLYIITKSNLGGAQKSVLETITALSKRKFIPSLACGGNGALFDELKTLGIPTQEIPSMGRDISFLKDIKSFFHILKIIKEEQPDIVHLHSPKAGALGALAVRLYNILSRISSLLTINSKLLTTIYTSHGWPFLESRPWWQKQILKFISFITVLLSHKTITISETEKNLASSWPFTKNKLVHIPLFITPTEFLPKDEARKKLQEKIGKEISKTTYLIGSIGELTKNKGFQTAINAVKDITDIQYIIIGEGELKETLKTDLPAHVALTGNIKNASSLLKAFDLFLLPSLKEGLPYTLLEAVQASLPIISTPVGSIKEVLEDDVSGLLVPSKEVSSLREKILITKKHNPLSLENLEKNRLRILEKHNKDKVMEQLEALYENSCI